MFDVVAGAALVDDDFVADCRDRLCAGLLADFIQDVFGVGFGVAQDGDFDEFVQFERKADVLDLIVARFGRLGLWFAPYCEVLRVENL